MLKFKDDPRVKQHIGKISKTHTNALVVVAWIRLLMEVSQQMDPTPAYSCVQAMSVVSMDCVGDRIPPLELVLEMSDSSSSPVGLRLRRLCSQDCMV